MLRTEELTKKYKHTVVLNEITLSFHEQEIWSILGPSGSGKTTLLRLMAGLDSPDKGRIFIDEEEVSSPEKIKIPSARKLSLIFQDLALWPHMTVRKNIEFAISGNGLTKREIKEKVNEALGWMHLETHSSRYPHQLSGGERQRLAIARALIARPKYLLMDEPFSSLDPFLVEELKKILLTLKNDYGLAIIYVTHDIKLALTMADRIVIINKGRIEQMGKREEVVQRPQSSFIRQFLKLEAWTEGVDEKHL